MSKPRALVMGDVQKGLRGPFRDAELYCSSEPAGMECGGTLMLTEESGVIHCPRCGAAHELTDLTVQLHVEKIRKA